MPTFLPDWKMCLHPDCTAHVLLPLAVALDIDVSEDHVRNTQLCCLLK